MMWTRALSHQTITMASLTTQLLTISIIALQRQMAHNRAASRDQWNSNYDYIVVGAGSAGAIVAARLTEGGNSNTVLLLEAGGPATIISDMPAEAWNGMLGENDWGYQTSPQANAGNLLTRASFSLHASRVISCFVLCPFRFRFSQQSNGVSSRQSDGRLVDDQLCHLQPRQ